MATRQPPQRPHPPRRGRLEPASPEPPSEATALVTPDGAPYPPPEKTPQVRRPRPAPALVPPPNTVPASTISPTAEEERARQREAERDQLNSMVALLVAISATLMALCNVKDGNVVQAMSVAQTNSVDSWSHYQSKSTKQSLLEVTIDQLSVERELLHDNPERLSQIERRIGEYRQRVARYEEEKKEIRQKAEEFTREYDRLNVHDDQLDLAEAGFSISIALYGVVALTHSRWLLLLSAIFTLVGLVFGAAGFFHWGLHPDFLTKLLS